MGDVYARSEIHPHRDCYPCKLYHSIFTVSEFSLRYIYYLAKSEKRNAGIESAKRARKNAIGERNEKFFFPFGFCV